MTCQKNQKKLVDIKSPENLWNVKCCGLKKLSFSFNTELLKCHLAVNFSKCLKLWCESFNFKSRKLKLNKHRFLVWRKNWRINGKTQMTKDRCCSSKCHVPSSSSFFFVAPVPGIVSEWVVEWSGVLSFAASWWWCRPLIPGSDLMRDVSNLASSRKILMQV